MRRLSVVSDRPSHMAIGITPVLFVALEWNAGEAGMRLTIGDTKQRFEDPEMTPPDVVEGVSDDQALTEAVRKLVRGRDVKSWESLEILLNAQSDQIAWFGPADMPSSARLFYEEATA
jgi:hypothetical protein